MSTFLDDGTMVDKMAQFNLSDEVADAERHRPWPAGLFAKTLFKKHDFRAVLICMQNSARMKEHHADGTISIHVIRGHLCVWVNGHPHEVPLGSLFTLAASIRHNVDAIGDSAFLLTISWPSDQELASMKHRGYGS